MAKKRKVKGSMGSIAKCDLMEKQGSLWIFRGHETQTLPDGRTAGQETQACRSQVMLVRKRRSARQGMK